jgi:hypothetical protein
MELKGIKESLELLQGIKVLAVDAKKIMANGKLDLSDLGVAMDLLKQLGTLSSAVQGIDQISSEVKDLSPEEVNQLAQKVLEVVEALRAA